MKLSFLFPCDYFDHRQVDPDFAGEHAAAMQFPEYGISLLDHDALLAHGKVTVRPEPEQAGICIYRGWMLLPEQYRQLSLALAGYGVRLINSPEEYDNCHLFPNIYPFIAAYTPKAVWFARGETVDWERINCAFPRFLLKDYVKSVKGSPFPQCFATPVDEAGMRPLLRQFIELRGSLYTSGLVFKEYVDLQRYAGTTNEYRAFFLDGRLLSLSRNAGQTPACPRPPGALVTQLGSLPSRFYTVDFAQCADGRWIVIETGDGQVSGLSPGQPALSFYGAIHAAALCDAPPRP